MLDEGHPMTMEPNMLKEIVLPPSMIRKLLNAAGVSGSVNRQGLLSMTNLLKIATNEHRTLHCANPLAKSRRTARQQ